MDTYPLFVEVVISACDIQGGTSAFGINSGVTYTGAYANNIDVNPFFVNPTSGTGHAFNAFNADFSLQNFSLCIDAGDPAPFAIVYPTNDLSGNPRILHSTIDIGAYEFAGIIGLKNNKTENGVVKCYPNPSTGIVKIARGNIKNIEVYDMLGKQLTLKQVIEVDGVQVDLSDCEEGVYLLRLWLMLLSIRRK
jgi:hypothetical protein